MQNKHLQPQQNANHPKIFRSSVTSPPTFPSKDRPPCPIFVPYWGEYFAKNFPKEPPNKSTAGVASTFSTPQNSFLPKAPNWVARDNGRRTTPALGVIDGG
jgi:hypothetical protein